MPFRNSVVGGTTLVRAAIRSPNYVAGVSGWSINRDGSAEFSDIVIRGTTGDAVIIGPAAGSQVVISVTGGRGQISFPTHQPQEEIAAVISAAAVNDGAANETIAFGLNGPASDVDSVRIRAVLQTTAEDSSAEAALRILREASGTDTLIATFRKQLADGVFEFLHQGRVSLQPQGDTSSSALLIGIPATYVGNWFRIQKNGTDRLVYDTNGVMVLRRTAAGDDVFQTRVDADTFARLNVDANGAMGWGDGSGSTDVSFDRSAVGTLRVTGDLQVTGNDTADAEDLTDRSVTSTTYATGTSLSVAIVCPTSGVIYVDTCVRGFNSSANGRIFQALLISGSTSGTLLSPIDDRSACVDCNIANETGSAMWGKRINLTTLGAVVGETITVTVQNRVSAGTATIQSRNVTAISLTS